MRVKQISVVYERKFNLGDYNSAHIGLTLWADLDEGEDPDAAVRELQQQAREFAKAEYRRLIKPGHVPANGTL